MIGRVELHQMIYKFEGGSRLPNGCLTTKALQSWITPNSMNPGAHKSSTLDLATPDSQRDLPHIQQVNKIMSNTLADIEICVQKLTAKIIINPRSFCHFNFDKKLRRVVGSMDEFTQLSLEAITTLNLDVQMLQLQNRLTQELCDKARMYEDVKASSDKMKGEYELRVAELQSQVEALKLEKAQSNLQMNDEGKQVDKKNESMVEVPVQITEKKSRQNYYLESLMLQNDQIQLEIKKLQQHINKQTVEENKKEEKAGISEHIFDLYIQLKDILKTTDYGKELKQMYFKAVKEETSQLLESCLKALLHLLRVAEEEEVSQTAEEPAMRESELASNKSPESPIKDDLSLRRESLDQDYQRYIKSISDEEESPKRLSNSPPQREEKVLQRVKQDNLKGQYLSRQSAKDQPQLRNGRESQQSRSSKQSVEEKRRFNKTKQNQENFSHNSRPQELPRKSSLKKLAQIPNPNEQQYSTNIQIYNDQHQNPFQKPSKPQYQPNYETMERQPDSRLEYYDGPIQSNHRRHSSQSSQASFGVAPARQSKAYQHRVQKQPKGPENLSIQNHGDSSYAALQLAKLHSQIQTPTFEMLSHQENNQRHKFIKTDNIKSTNAHGLPSGQVKHRIK